MDVILTGDRPTGRLHLGHYVGSLKRRVEMQNSGKYDTIYIMIADAQAIWLAGWIPKSRQSLFSHKFRSCASYRFII